MKKVVAIILALLMLMPTVYADSSVSTELESVLVEVKTKVEIPSELSVFESNISNYNEKTYYDFDWHTPDYEKSLSINADENGNIRNYNFYTQKISKKRISSVSKKEIISFAEDFIRKTVPKMYADATDVLVLDEKSYSAEGAMRYSFSYNREKNSVLVKDNFVYITVGISDEDKPYIRNMSANLDFETPFDSNKAEIENYVQKYKDAFPVELVFRNEHNPKWREKGQPRYKGALIYRIKDNQAGYISLETGEVVVEDRGEDIIFKEESSSGAMMDSANKNESSLTPEELAEITKVEGLLSVGEIEKKIKALPYVKFPSGVVLTSSHLAKNDDGNYVYNLSYSSEKKDYYNYLHISAYAQDGKLISLNRSEDENRKEIGALTEYQRGVAENKIKQFLEASAGEEFSETRLQETTDKNGYVNSYYYRTIEGVKHINEGISVAYDAENAIITNFSLHFTQTGFPTPQTAILDDIAYDKITEYSPVIKMYIKSGEKYVLCATLENRSIIIDGLTGELKDEIKDQNKSFSYDDVKGHWAEEAASKLAEIQIGFEGGKLNPDSKIAQEEFLRFCASGIYGKYYHTYETKDLYEALIRDGILSEKEQNPTAEVTREDAFVFIIRMAGLEKVAKLENIYKVDFADSNLLTAGQIGYCAILSGMGIICGDGGYLRPQDNLTRAEAVVMLYRYLLTL